VWLLRVDQDGDFALGRHPDLFAELLFHAFRFLAINSFLPNYMVAAVLASLAAVLIEFISRERAANRMERALLNMTESSPICPIPSTTWKPLPVPIKKLLGDWAVLRPPMRARTVV